VRATLCVVGPPIGRAFCRARPFVRQLRCASMAAEEGKSFARRDLLQQIESDVQKTWEETKIFEQDAPHDGKEKFMVTFPYPYMNGLLHIGHAFSLTKSVFAAHFERLNGKNAIFPFGFHCTGMPIQAAANKLKREFEVYGAPYPTFPAGVPSAKEDKEGNIELDDEGVTLVWKPPSSTGQKAIKAHHVFMKVGESDFKEVAAIPHPSPEVLKEQGKKVAGKVPVEAGGCVYTVQAELADGSMCPMGKESAKITTSGVEVAKSAGGPPGKRVAKKIQAKTGDAAFQYEILLSMGLKPDELAPFSDPMHWLEFFPPLGVRDLKSFGAPIDFRRSFITTSVNPYYDSFIRWQFTKLKAGDKIGFGKRPTIFSEVDGQACMDHDRAEGEGVAPQQYTGIKLEVLDQPAALQKLKGKRVFLLAATLRPETMVGQTNCWILPTGKYGCFKAGDKDVFVCSHRAARNMSFQEVLTPWAKPECLLEITGKDIMGCKLKAPHCPYEFVHLLPLMTIKMDKGTGIVTSVPSDSPDDYACYMDLMKPGKRDYHGVKAEWIEPFPLVPCIDTEIDDEVRHMAAEYMCNKLGVQSQNDTLKLQEAHDACYKLGFDRGVMSVGPLKGQPVKTAKDEIKKMMVKDGLAIVYSEPEKKVVSRSGDECVVAGIDQWFLRYGEESWRKTIEGHINGDNFNAYNDRINDSFMQSIAWLKEWACSRSFGLGTRVPWDEQFLIESLSDSTIYMAYYTVAHILQNGILDGSEGNPDGIKPEDLTNEVWDFVFLHGAKPNKSKIPAKVLDKMRHEFRYWYPVDLRVSGKDLIQNHLTMFLYNHACVWEKEPEMWPRSIFCNGWCMVNNEKMSKSKGNFFTLEDIIKKYSADTVRIACADAGDTLEDSNIQEAVANQAILRLAVMLETLKAMVDKSEPLQKGKDDARFVDRWFKNDMNRLVIECKSFYEKMMYREALRTAYFEFTAAFDQYRDVCKALGGLPNEGLVMQYWEWQLIILSPICPHFCEHGWSVLGKSGSVLNSRFPIPSVPVDASIIMQGSFMFDKAPHDFIKLIERESKKGRPTAATVYVAKSFPEWKISVLEKLRTAHKANKLPLVSQDEMKNDETAKAQWKEIMTALTGDPAMKPFAKHLGPFAAFKRDGASVNGVAALEAKAPFDELTLVMEHVQYLKDKLRLADLTVCDSSAPKEGDAQAAADAEPEKPTVRFSGSSGVAPKAAAKGGAKAKAGGAAPGAKSVAKGPAISDMKKLNEHLATCSYVDGGAGPTAQDAAQLEAMPAAIPDDLKHVGRWYRHIRHFTAAQRGRW